VTKSLEEEIMIKAREVRGTARYMASFEDLVEERIRKAREKGVFDNLEGQGKPLNLYENPFEPADMRMVNKILKDNGFSPYWVELGKEVDAALDNFWLEVKRFQTLMRVTRKDNGSNEGLIQRRTDSFILDAQAALEGINKKIDNFNCHCPLWWLGRGRINVNTEMQKVRAALSRIPADDGPG
jgi:hypothetical protein